MPIFGDKNKLAISCKLPNEKAPSEQSFIWCHYIVAGDLIGCEEEYDLLGTCVTDLERGLKKIIDLKAGGHEPTFTGLSDIEVLNAVRKANQFEIDFDPQFMHLPQQPDSFWYAHKLWLAESTDKAEVVVFNSRENLKLSPSPITTIAVKSNQLLLNSKS